MPHLLDNFVKYVIGLFWSSKPCNCIPHVKQLLQEHIAAITGEGHSNGKSDCSDMMQDEDLQYFNPRHPFASHA